MKKFKNPLATVKKVQEAEVKIAQKELFLIENEIFYAHQQQKELIAKAAEVSFTLETALKKGGLASSAVQRSQDYLECCREQQKNSEKKIAENVSKMVDCRERLTEAAQKKKGLEKLYQQHRDRWIEKRESEDNRQLDEIYTLRKKKESPDT